MAQLYVDDALKAYKIFEQLNEKEAFEDCALERRIPIRYDGPPAFAVYKNSGRKKKGGGFVFKKTALVFGEKEKAKGA